MMCALAILAQVIQRVWHSALPPLLLAVREITIAPLQQVNRPHVPQLLVQRQANHHHAAV